MPRRKQDCPKRMKWELENLAAAAALRKAKGGGVNVPKLNLKQDSNPEPESSDENSSDDEQKSSESEDSPSRSRGGSESRESDSPSPFKTPSPVPTNGSILDFSQRRGGSPSMGGGECPLDLSVTHKKEDSPPPKKLAKWSSERRGLWNGSSQDMSSKALEKMSELSRVGHQAETKGSSGRSGSSSWQAQWLAQSSCGTKDVLRCVSCRQTFPTIQALSGHMKEANHGPPLVKLPSPKGLSSQGHSPGHGTNHVPISVSHPKSSSSPTDASALLKETVQLPRKLVRGQDVWLGKGAEQTRQILKCMWCGQSFQTLDQMTSHMQQTQHYTNIISQEQLISWRSSEDKSASPNSHVSAVLTCKVCDQAFSSLKDLSTHMMKNSHYKEHIMRSITESGSRRRQSREKRKKSLPVRKLLELERANTELKKDTRSSEKGSEKIPPPTFVEHLRLIEKGTLGSSGPIALTTPNKRSPKRDLQSESASDLSLSGSSAKDEKRENSSVLNAIEKMIEKSFDYRSKGGAGSNNSHAISPPVGTSILKRLGIDESVDYTKPLLDPSMLPIPSSKYSHSRPRSVSSEKSDEIKLPASSTPPGHQHVTLAPPLESKSQNNHHESKRSSRREERERMEVDSEPPTDKETKKGNKSSLSALSSMFDSIGGGGSGNGGTQDGSRFHHSPQSNSQHPLAALQHLCDKTENTPPVTSSASRPTSTSSSNPQSSPGVDPTSLLGLNWAVNDGENVFKCTFCESPFLSKGAYRHHLAKMHFVQEKSPTPAPKDEVPPSDSPTSKFIKYTELAKQLSSK